MALIKCSECGKEFSDTASSCPNCGYVFKQKNNINKNKIENIISLIKQWKFFIGGGALFIIVIIIIISNASKPNIVGTWERSSSVYGIYIRDTYEFERNGKATFIRQVDNVKNEWKCKYKFRKNNTQIKISCDYDSKEAREKNNIWVNFEMIGDKLYIDNKEYTK